MALGGLGGLGVGVPVASAVSAPAVGSASRPLRIGFLLPSSGYIPDLGARLLAGFRLGLSAPTGNRPPISFDIFADSLELGGANTGSKIQKLLAMNRPDIIVGMFGAGEFYAHKEAFEKCERPVINITMGADIQTESISSDNVISLSAGTWQCAMAAGEIAAEMGSRGVMVSGFLEAGYDMHFAIQRGFESKGGTILSTQVLGVSGRSTSAELALQGARELGADVILAPVSERVAFELRQAMHAMNWSTPVIGVPHFAESTARYPVTASGIGHLSTGAWSSALDTSANQSFQQQYQESVDESADLFSVLGWEAAHLMMDGLVITPNPAKASSLFVESLAQWQMHSPRGLIQTKRDARLILGPVYLRKTVSEGRHVAHSILKNLEPASASDFRFADFHEAEKQNLSGGWVNEYLCV